MTIHERQIRSANATAEDARHFVALAQMAGDDVFSDLLGGRAEATLSALFGRDDNDLSYRHASFLLIENEVAGLLHGFAAPDANDELTTRLMLRCAGWQLPRFLLIAILLRDILDFLGSDLRDRDYYINFLAVYPDYRGRGLSQVLLNQAWSLARGSGCDRLALDVDERNRIAIGAYEKAGFKRIAESKKIRHGGERFGLLRLATDPR